jgi:hypothetical protein
MASSQKYFIYFYNWWPGFENRTDANHIGFYEKLLANTKLKDFEITTDLNKANVLVEAGKPNKIMRNVKKWKYKINFVGEPDLPEFDNYDLILTSVNNKENVVDLPLSIAYIHCNNFLSNLCNRSFINKIPSQFCSFIVSNPKCEIRNKLFHKLNNYKKVNSMGSHENNIGGKISYPYWSNEFFNVIGSHKFMICCENTKMETYSTEKIVNPYIAKTIPIYWGSHNIKNIFNLDSMLFLENETDEAFEKLINKIIELDNDDEKYLEFINRPIFTQDNINFWNANYTLESIGKKIDNII